MAAANGVFVAIVYSAFNLCVFLLSLGGVIGPCTDFRWDLRVFLIFFRGLVVFYGLAIKLGSDNCQDFR